MKLKCDICKKIIKQPGALVFGPPILTSDKPFYTIVDKIHVCVECWKWLTKTLVIKSKKKDGERK